MNLLELRSFSLGMRMKPAPCWYSLLLAATFACVAHGQAVVGAAPAAVTGSQVTTLSATVDEVPLELTVHNKKHKPILDLKPEEITVTDNDTPVKLSGFHLVENDASMDHVVTMVFDHFDGGMAKSAQNAATKVLQLFPAKGYSFAVLDFGQRMRLLQGFTADRKDVGQAIIAETEKAETGRTTAIEQAEKDLIAVAQTGADASGRHLDLKDRALDQTLLAALEDTRHIIQDQHARLNLAGLMALVRSQQRLSQRKTLIYFTHNGVMDSAAREMIHSIAGAATRAGVSVYTFDMDTLNSQGYQSANAQILGVTHFNPNTSTISAGPANTMANHPTGPPPVRDEGALDSAAEGYSSTSTAKNPIADLSRDTDGLYIDAQEGLKKPLQQMLEEMTTYYLASYVSPIKEYDGSFRAIAIKTTRPGIQIHTRSGYFALPPGASLKDLVPEFSNPVFRIKEEDKPLYHALCALGANLPVMLWQKTLAGLEVKFRIPRAAVLSYFRSALANFEADPVGALTGPIVRGDAATVQTDIDALGRDPFAGIYGAFASAYAKTSYRNSVDRTKTLLPAGTGLAKPCRRPTLAQRGGRDGEGRVLCTRGRCGHFLDPVFAFRSPQARPGPQLRKK